MDCVRLVISEQRLGKEVVKSLVQHFFMPGYNVHPRRGSEATITDVGGEAGKQWFDVHRCSFIFCSDNVW